LGSFFAVTLHSLSSLLLLRTFRLTSRIRFLYFQSLRLQTFNLFISENHRGFLYSLFFFVSEAAAKVQPFFSFANFILK